MSERKEKIRFFIIIGITLLIGAFILIYENGSSIVLERSYSNLEQIVIDSDLSDVEVKYIGSDEVNVVVYGKNHDIIKVDEGRTDIVIEKESSREICIFNCLDKIILYLPKNFKKLEVNTSLGNVDTREVNIEKLYVNTSAGNIDAGLVNEVIIKNDIGNTSIKEIDATSDCSISSNTGDVTIDKVNNINIYADSNVGKVDIDTNNNEKNKYTLNIKTEVGNIKVR